MKTNSNIPLWSLPWYVLHSISLLRLLWQIITNLVLTTAEVYSLTVLESIYLKWRCWQGPVLWKSFKNSLFASSRFWWSQALLSFGQKNSTISTSVFTWLSSPCVCLHLCIQIFFFLKEPSHTEVTVSLTKLTLSWEVKVAQSCLFATPWMIQSMEFSGPEYWSGYPCLSPGNLPIPHCRWILY